MNTPKNNATQAARDLRFMHAAIRYSRRHVGITGTNPSVACLIVASVDGGLDEDNQREDDQYWIAGRGVTAIGGRPHAEPVALEEAGEFARGATAYVTLEPCAHHGVTAPCAATLIDAGIVRVVSAGLDPDGRVDSKGFAMLREAGIEVVEDIATDEAAWGLRGYLSRKSRLRPWVTLKLAMSFDGFLGFRDGEQIAITGPITNAQTHLLRARNDAILVGSGTVINDDPSLTCRLPGLRDRSPIRIALENTNPIPDEGNFIQLASEVATYIACPQEVLQNRKNQMAGTACKFIACDTKRGLVALPELLADLSDLGIATLMVEGGEKVARAFLKDQLVDEIILYVASENMANKAAGTNENKWISSPLSPNTIPDGFHISDQWQYGTDKIVRMICD